MTLYSRSEGSNLPAPKRVEDQNQFINNKNFYDASNNLFGEVVVITDTEVSSDTEFEVKHSLNRFVKYVQILVTENQTSAYLSVRPSGTPWTKNTIYLECNTANAALSLRLT